MTHQNPTWLREYQFKKGIQNNPEGGFQRGTYQGHGFKKGLSAWNKGLKCDWVTERNKTNNPLKNDDSKEKMRNSKTGKPLTEAHKAHMRGKIRTAEQRKVWREKSINYLQNRIGIPYPCLGKHEKTALDVMEECIGYPIQRQKQIAGYYLDGYCPVLNLAIEIDEPQHNKVADRQREQNIQKKQYFQFLRIEVGGD